jgi:hypothetical protein
MSGNSPQPFLYVCELSSLRSLSTQDVRSERGRRSQEQSTTIIGRQFIAGLIYKLLSYLIRAAFADNVCYTLPLLQIDHSNFKVQQMKMKVSSILIAFACAAALCLTGFVHPHAASASEIVPPLSPTTGTIQVTVHITFKSNIPSNDVIACSVQATVQGEPTTFRETAIRQGGRNGNSATCVVPIPYSWLLQNGNNDTINLQYETIVPPESINLGNITFPYRDNIQSGTITPVPVSGTQTNITVDATL